jgi:hypothetical protein
MPLFYIRVSVRAAFVAALFFGIAAGSAMAQESKPVPLASVEVQPYKGDVSCGKWVVKRTYEGASNAQIIFRLENIKTNEVVGQNRALVDAYATGKPTAEQADTKNGPGFLFHFDPTTWNEVQVCFDKANFLKPPPASPPPAK